MLVILEMVSVILSATPQHATTTEATAPCLMCAPLNASVRTAMEIVIFTATAQPVISMEGTVSNVETLSRIQPLSHCSMVVFLDMKSSLLMTNTYHLELSNLVLLRTCLFPGSSCLQLMWNKAMPYVRDSATVSLRPSPTAVTRVVPPLYTQQASGFIRILHSSPPSRTLGTSLLQFRRYTPNQPSQGLLLLATYAWSTPQVRSLSQKEVS